jgi:hypothetical protein
MNIPETVASLLEEAEENLVDPRSLDELVNETLYKIKFDSKIRFLLEHGVSEETIHDAMVKKQFMEIYPGEFGPEKE